MNYCDCFAHKNSTLADIIPQELYALAELGGGQDGPWPPLLGEKVQQMHGQCTTIS
jgi:hypothetical protein